ncbi:hypothetical protein RSSM_05667 [Rhodopirellula sallentina SM41]|uniref:Uncharacterized protein n=1 Tax=Rhodopirellula sallentina SM41 TaxID=1263870 RepID=M5UA14_9BACT|nr:hypothetical protein RSSM_05667 [Rhodopirellula sallentina SM41]
MMRCLKSARAPAVFATKLCTTHLLRQIRSRVGQKRILCENWLIERDDAADPT